MKLVINFKKVRDTILSHKTLLLKVWIAHSANFAPVKVLRTE